MGRKAGHGDFKGGRKAVHPDKKRVNVTVKLPMWLREWLQDQPESQGRLIEYALIATYHVRMATYEIETSH